MRSSLLAACVLSGILAASGETVQAGLLLYGITQTSGDSTSLVSINQTTGEATVLQSFALSSSVISVENLTFYAPGNVFVTRVQNPAGTFHSVGVIDPSAGTFTEVAISGLSAAESIAGIAYDPFANQLLATFGDAFNNRILEFDLSGNILQTTGDLGFFDRDNIAVHPVTGEIILEDTNDPPPGSMPGLVALTDPFGTPMSSTFADPPAETFFDIAISDTGRVLFARSGLNDLVELNVGPDTYTTIGPFGLNDSVTGIAFANLTPVPEPTSLTLAMLGSLGAR